MLVCNPCTLMSNIHCLNCKSTNNFLYDRAVDIEYYTTNEVYSYYKCKNCNVLFINPVPADKLPVIYPSNYYSYSVQNSFVHRVKKSLDKQLFRTILKKIPSTSINVLDVGGGTGSLLDIIKKSDLRINFTQVVDIDTSAQQLAVNNGHSYFCGTIEQFETNIKFDVILLLNLIEHIQSPSSTLIKLKSILSEHGIILVKTPNYDSLDATLFKNKNWAGYHCPRHWVLFQKESFMKLSNQAGFKLLYFKYTQGASFWTISFLNQFKKSRLIQINKEHPVFDHPLYLIFSGFFAAFDFLRSFFFKTSQMFCVLGQK